MIGILPPISACVPSRKAPATGPEAVDLDYPLKASDFLKMCGCPNVTSTCTPDFEPEKLDVWLVRVSPIHAVRSESRLMPDQPLVRSAAKVPGEPISPNAAHCTNDRNAQKASFAQARGRP
jgi:hypothetical protein